MSNQRSGQRTPGPTTRLPSKPSSKKKKPVPLGKTGAVRPSKSFQGGGPLISGTAVVSGNASSSAKAVQSVVPKSTKSRQVGEGSHEPVLPDNSGQNLTGQSGHAAGSSASNTVYPGSSSLSFFSAYKHYGVFSPRKIFAYLAWIALLPCRALMAWSASLARRVLLARKLLLIALVLGLFASVAVSIRCNDKYSQLNSQLEKYSHANQNSSAQLNASALRLQDLEKQTLGLSNRIESINGMFQAIEGPQINWLSPRVGAIIIPELCSPPSPPKKLKVEYSNLEKAENLKSQEASESHKNAWYYQWLGIKAQLPINSGLSAPGPATALLPWTEAERRYCVPDGRVLQLAVSIPRYILPTRLVIEHWRRGKVPGSFMRRAPKDIELWSYIEGEDDAAKVRDEFFANHPSLTANYSQQNGSLHSKHYLGFPWIPIGVFRYEVDMARNLQEFRIKYDLKIPMKRFAIRVISNWGYLSETCLVRVRLNGEEWTIDKS